LSSVVDAAQGRAAVTSAFRAFFLAIAAFHSESTRAKLDPGQFHRTLEEQLAGADAQAQSSGIDMNLYQQAKYAAVALADDLALHSDWDHAQQWNRYLLELRHFNTSFAGQEFFERLGRLRQQLAGVQDPGLREQVIGTMEVYYTCLKLGFRGRYRGAQQAEIENFANSILMLLWPQGPQGMRQRVWADAYREPGRGRILYGQLLWWWWIPASFVAAVALWFIFSARQVSRVNTMVEQVSAPREGAAGDAGGKPR
jgi:type IV/VI secretion system ImpK/VasF family protein